jgi:hypothetical protein
MNHSGGTLPSEAVRQRSVANSGANPRSLRQNRVCDRTVFATEPCLRQNRVCDVSGSVSLPAKGDGEGFWVETHQDRFANF